MSNIKAVARAHLIANAGVTALVGSRIYSGLRPRNGDLPCITMALVSGESQHHLVSESRLANRFMQVACWGATYDSAADVANAVRLAISGLTGEWGTGANTATVESCVLRGSYDTYDEQQDGTQIVSAEGVVDDYSLIYIQTPAS